VPTAAPSSALSLSCGTARRGGLMASGGAAGPDGAADPGPPQPSPGAGPHPSANKGPWAPPSGRSPNNPSVGNQEPVVNCIDIASQRLCFVFQPVTVCSIFGCQTFVLPAPAKDVSPIGGDDAIGRGLRATGGTGGGSGLRDASAGLRELFSGGSVRGKSIIEIREILTRNGFQQGRSESALGYLFRNAAGEEVRIMRRGGGWDIRIRNRYGNYLDEFGDVPTGPGPAHGIDVEVR